MPKQSPPEAHWRRIPASDYRAMTWRMMSEDDFQTNVVKLADALGWGPIYHTRFSIGSKRGYPDLHMLRGNRSLFAELKSMRGTVPDAQKMWLEALRAAGHEAYLWRPSDIDEIEAVLAAKERPK